MTTERESGFTLLELLVVLVLATLMLSLVVPRFAAVLPGVELKSYTQKTAALLRQLRSQAMAESRLVSFSVDPQDHALRVSHRADPIALPDDIDVTLNDDGSLALGYDVVVPLSNGATSGGPSIRFYPDGSSSGGRVRLTGSSGQYGIDVDWLTGRVRIDDGREEELPANED